MFFKRSLVQLAKFIIFIFLDLKLVELNYYQMELEESSFAEQLFSPCGWLSLSSVSI